MEGFRVWCEDRYEWEKDRCYLSTHGELFCDGRVGIVPLSRDTHIVQWYTGIKDKNGKMICEGDIVKVNDDLAVVRLADGCTEVKYIGQHYIDNLFIVNSFTEIVGNIFNNADLLD